MDRHSLLGPFAPGFYLAYRSDTCLVSFYLHLYVFWLCMTMYHEASVRVSVGVRVSSVVTFLMEVNTAHNWESLHLKGSHTPPQRGTQRWHLLSLTEYVFQPQVIIIVYLPFSAVSGCSWGVGVCCGGRASNSESRDENSAAFQLQVTHGGFALDKDTSCPK